MEVPVKVEGEEQIFDIEKNTSMEEVLPEEEGAKKEEGTSRTTEDSEEVWLGTTDNKSLSSGGGSGSGSGSGSGVDDSDTSSSSGGASNKNENKRNSNHISRRRSNSSSSSSSSSGSSSSFSFGEEEYDPDFNLDSFATLKTISSEGSLSKSEKSDRKALTAQHRPLQLPSHANIGSPTKPTRTGRDSPTTPTQSNQNRPSLPIEINNHSPKPPQSQSKSNKEPPSIPTRTKQEVVSPPARSKSSTGYREPPTRTNSGTPPARSKSYNTQTIPKQTDGRRLKPEPTREAPRRTSSYTSSGVIYSRKTIRPMETTIENPAEKKSMDGFRDRVRKPGAVLEFTDEDEFDGDATSVDEEKSKIIRPPLNKLNALPSASNFNNKLSSEDIEICRRLDEEYERALEEREIGYNARYSSVRQSAFLSVFFMVAYLILGTAFFARQTAWTIPDSLLFSIYTITTVGYGRSDIPTTPGFQSYTIFYILVGIAALTIMVAQVYQCIALEASRAQHGRDKTEMARRGLDILTSSSRGEVVRGNVHGEASADEIIAYHNDNMPGVIDTAFRCYDRAKSFFKNDEIGRSISVVFPFAGLILVGALVVGPIEGWTFLESVYFSVVSLTTVGFGDYVPRELTSIWFCVMWLPFSVGFMSLYLGNVAAFYIRLSDRNIQRIERQMRRRVLRAKEKAERERAEVLRRAYRGQEMELEAVAAASADGSTASDEQSSSKIPPQHAKSLLARRKKKSGFDAVPTNDGTGSEDGSERSESHSLFGSTPLENISGKRRQRILENSNTSMASTDRPDGRTMQSMRDIVRAVRRNLSESQKPSDAAAIVRSGPDVQFMSIRSTQTMPSHASFRRAQRRKPSFALRVLVQERFAEIIATEIAGFQSSIEIQDQTLSVTIESMQDTADKWLVPRRARKAFRAVSFEVLYFVGEHGLITRGADALYDLSPFEFHGLFSPLVAAMGDAETMEGWLASTDILADVDLRRDGTRPGLSVSGESTKLTAAQQERLRKNSNRAMNQSNHTKLQKISPGSAFHN